MSEVWYSGISESSISILKQNIDYVKLSQLKELNILDFGCGNGRYMHIFKQLFPQSTIFGVDISEKNIADLRDTFQNVEVLNPEKMSLNYKQNYFDLIFSSNVIEHIPYLQYQEYIKKIYEILKKNSRFVFGTPNYPYKRFYDMEKALRAFLKFNFHDFKYYLFDDPTHINPLNFKKLEGDFKMFANLDLQPSKIFLKKILKNKKYADKINGIAIK